MEDADSDFDFELGEETTGSIKLDLSVEFYLRGREEPLHILTKYFAPAIALREAEDPVETLMSYFELSILQIIDTRGEERYVFTDSHHNKRFVMAADVQSISALAPDPSTLDTLLELADS